MSDVDTADDTLDLVPLGVALDNLAQLRTRGIDPYAITGTTRLTDTGNAEQWVAAHGSRFRFHASRGAWFRWDGARWKDDVEGEALLSTKDVARDYLTAAIAAGDPKTRIDLVKHANKAESKGSREAMLALAASEPGISVGAAAFDADPWALNCSNGILDLKTGTLRPHSASELHSKIAPVDFDADAKCPRFDRFLEEILPDAPVRSFVMRFFGYALTGVVREHVLPVFYGSGGNGKGTLVETLGAVVGDYGKAIGADLLMRKQGGGEQHPTERATLLGLRLAFASETEAGRALAESTVKTLTGGDSISARFMRQDFFEFSPSHKIALTTNHRPVIKGTDKGIWRRVRLVPFTEVPSIVDTSLKETLAAERPGILARLVAACLEWQREGLGSAGAIDLATAGYRAESDVVGQFIDDSCVVQPAASVRATELYTAYAQWAEANGEHAWTQRAFGLALSERGIERAKAHGTKVYRGLGLLADRGTRGTFDRPNPVNPPNENPHGVNRNGRTDGPPVPLSGSLFPKSSFFEDEEEQKEKEKEWGGDR